MKFRLPLGFLLLLLICSFSIVGAAEPLRQVRITADNPRALAIELERAGYDLLEGSVTVGELDLVVTVAELETLRQRGYAIELIAVGRPFSEIQAERQAGDSVPPGYLNLTEVVAEMADVAATYPEICQLVNLTTTYGLAQTFDGNDLYAVKVSDNVSQEDDEPSYLMVGAHHCREIVTPVLALYALDQFTSQYGSNPVVTQLVDSYEIWIAPVWNPDGYDHVFYYDNMWRKNRRVFAQGIGVDLNRNYPQGWYNGCSGSTSPSSSIYKGPDPASEAETQTMVAWSTDQRFAKVIDYHSSGREVLHGYACWSYPFDSYLQQEAIDVSVAAGYGGDHRGPSADGEHYEWQFGKQGALAFLIETAYEFQPSYSSAQSEAIQVWPSTLWHLDRPIPLWGHVTDAVTSAPVVASISYVGVNFPNNETNTSGGAHGRYHAFMPNGTYDVVFEAEDYVTQTFPGVVINTNSSLLLDVQLVPETTAVALDEFPGQGGDAVVLTINSLDRTLRYQIDRPTHASLRIFDVRGTLVRTLVEKDLLPGQYDAVWFGRDNQGRRVASGSYFYRLATDHVAASGKLLVIR